MIKNRSKKTLLCEKHTIIEDILVMSIGLMFQRQVSEALVFRFRHPTRACLHMMFVFMPIDIVLTDEQGTVLEVKENFRPFTIYNSSMKCRNIIEAKAGAVKESRTTPGDKLEFV
ncbi:DUF192 domain-containing protein [Candidatus Woesearchaeota archaeon]|nr:DUF192 domain-containing protein [Candidatus Woesearchaeota archaeon]